MQYIFQNPFGSLNPTMTVAENVEEPLRHFENLARRERREKALAALETVSLGSQFADILPGRSSGGERQRAAVARALVVEPEILVCDEITSALDVSVQATVLDLLRDLRRERDVSLLFITHDLGVVAAIADEVLVLDHGRICESGRTRALLANPQDAYTNRLLQSAPSLTTSIGVWDARDL
jgi:peptide/nickel transport system ATP-binding protein